MFLNTTWTSPDIWLRREFTVDADDLSAIKLQVFHDEDAEVYFNGALAAQMTRFITEYDDFEISSVAMKALHAGTNLIAAHCHQTSGGQGIDIGIIRPLGKTEKSSP